MRKALFIILTLLLMFLVACSSGNKISGDAAVENTQPAIGSDNAKEMKIIQTFTLSGENFKFLMDGKENPDLIVNEGDKVRIEFTSSQGFHDFVIDELNAKTNKVNEGNSTSIEFIAGKKGIFEYYCSVGEHRKMGMKGRFIVQ